MLIKEPFKNAVSGLTRTLPVIRAISLENDGPVKILFHGSGAVRHMQYLQLKDRFKQRTGYETEYVTGYYAFSSQATNENGLALDSDNFVMLVKGKDLDKMIDAFVHLKIISEEEEDACLKEYHP